MNLPDSLRFCLATTFYPPYHFGGDAVHVHRLAEALASRGHRVDVIHSIDAYRLQRRGEPEVPFAHHPNVRVHALQTKRPRLSALASHQLGDPAFYGSTLGKLLDKRAYDVIHFHNVSLLGGPRVLRRGRAVKLCTAHDYWWICPTHALFAFNRTACRARHCLSCTLHAKRPPQLWRYTGLRDRCLDAIDCLIMPSLFAMQKHREAGVQRPMVRLPCLVEAVGIATHNAARSRPYFLCAGRLEKLKGVQDLLRLFTHYRDADLLIAGTGGYESVWREQANGLPHVHFLGQVSPAALATLYRHALGVLVPSLCYETFGLAAAEALSHGTPVIARRIGALAELVEETRAGFTFESLEECRHLMEQLRARPDLRITLGERGADFAHRHWSTEAHLRQYLDLVATLLEQRRERLSNAA